MEILVGIPGGPALFSLRDSGQVFDLRGSDPALVDPCRYDCSWVSPTIDGAWALADQIVAGLRQITE